MTDERSREEMERMARDMDRAGNYKTATAIRSPMDRPGVAEGEAEAKATGEGIGYRCARWKCDKPPVQGRYCADHSIGSTRPGTEAPCKG